MSEDLEKKISDIKTFFSPLSPEKRYHALMEMGRKLPLFDEKWKTEENIVRGCQSTLYLHTSSQNGKLYFRAHSDAFISAGLSALLILVYSGETPETILKFPPAFIGELGLAAHLSPSRSNGLGAIHLRMKQEALKFLMKS